MSKIGSLISRCRTAAGLGFQTVMVRGKLTPQPKINNFENYFNHYSSNNMRLSDLYNPAVMHELIYDFPDDQGRTLDRLVSELSETNCRELIVTPLEKYRLTVEHEPLEFMLVQISSSLNVTDANTILLHGELMVPAAARHRVEDILAQQPHIAVSWSELFSVTGFSGSMVSFAEKWEQIVGPELQPIHAACGAANKYLAL